MKKQITMEFGEEYYKEIDILKNDLTPFHKRNSYSPQKEYRFCISNFETPMTFEIGNIEDIATLIQLQPTVTV